MVANSGGGYVNDNPVVGDGTTWEQKAGDIAGLAAPLFSAKPKGPNFTQAINLFNTLSQQQQMMLNKAVAVNQLGANRITGAFDRARQGVTQAKGVAQQATRDIAQQSLASAQNSAIGRGLYNTSTFDAANRGIGSDLAKHLAFLEAQSAGAMGGLDTAQAAAEAGSYSHIGQLFPAFANSQAAMAGPLLQGMTSAGQNPGSKGGGFGDVLKLAATVIPMFSDPRLKCNIEQIGVLKHRGRGIPIYTFEYINPSLPGTYTGVMSPDVRHLGVVSTSPAGYEMVDYEKLRRITGWESKYLGERMREPRRKRKVKA